uniref:Uncharacterized protein n=1 Tax=Fibrocapsa japonica TaxID=94617 RepID=A0A7S2Y479_9STRA|mmetsp:Transcript_7322/g.11011  ORF Transcript_7322/g.11011 Transcript_7322/m.11011 type:complete len:135 (+) Transcript_7322:56-460(+)
MMKLQGCLVSVFVLVLVAEVLIDPGHLFAEALKKFREEACGSQCMTGRCRFRGCGQDDPTSDCVGGNCEFLYSHNSKCTGGSCLFSGCWAPECGGGGCTINDPKTTLRDGYCDGGGCTVNGEKWPSHFENKLTV